MKISLPNVANVAILKMEDKYQCVGVTGGVHSSLGVYESLRKGVCKVLEQRKLKLPFRIQFEELWRKCEKNGWNEDELFNLDSIK
jgi:hypothetical protein